MAFGGNRSHPAKKWRCPSTRGLILACNLDGMRNFPAKPSKLASIGVIGMLLCSSVLGHDADNSGTMKPIKRPEKTSGRDLAKLSAQARVVYVSSGRLPLAKRMIDGDAATAFDFSSSDPHPTAIIELAETERLHRVTALYRMEEGRLDIYLLNEFDRHDSDIIKGTPIASLASNDGGKAAVDFEPRGARYVALRWTRKKAITTGFEIAEVGAFTVASNSVLDWVQPPSFVQSSVHMTSNGGTDFSNTLGTLAAPPTIAPISP